MRQVGFSDNARGRQVCPGCGRLLTFFLSSGLSFFIASWRAVSSFFFSSAEEVALIFVMKENVCAKEQPLGLGVGEEPHGGDRAGGAPCTAECRRASHPRSTTSSYPSAACRAEIAEGVTARHSSWPAAGARPSSHAWLPASQRPKH